VCFCSQSGGGAGIGPLTLQLISRDCGRRAVSLVTRAKSCHVKRQGLCERNPAITHLVYANIVYLNKDGTLVLPDYMDKSDVRVHQNILTK